MAFGFQSSERVKEEREKARRARERFHNDSKVLLPTQRACGRGRDAAAEGFPRDLGRRDADEGSGGALLQGGLSSEDVRNNAAAGGSSKSSNSSLPDAAAKRYAAAAAAASACLTSRDPTC